MNMKKERKEVEATNIRLKEKDLAKTRKVGTSAGSKLEQEEAQKRLELSNNKNPETTDRMRVLARRKYLTEREQKMVQELGDFINDEEYIFEEENLTAAEMKQLQLNKKIYKYTQDRLNLKVDDDAYHMQAAVEVSSKKKEQNLLHARYEKKEEVKVNEQEEWESHQAKMAKMEFGALNGVPPPGGKKYELVFEDHIEFIQSEILAGDSDKQQKPLLNKDNLKKRN